MPDRYLDKFKSNNERKCSKRDEAKCVVFVRKDCFFSLVWVGPAFKRPARGGFKSGWVLKNYTKNCAQKLKKIKSERSDYGHFCVHNRRSRR